AIAGAAVAGEVAAGVAAAELDQRLGVPDRVEALQCHVAEGDAGKLHRAPLAVELAAAVAEKATGVEFAVLADLRSEGEEAHVAGEQREMDRHSVALGELDRL